MCKVNSSLYYVQKTATTGKQSASGQTHWIPNTDVYATEGQLVIKVELAGMRREDLELTVEGNRLMISGQRPDGGRGSKCKFLVLERSEERRVGKECRSRWSPKHERRREVRAMKIVGEELLHRTH